MTSRMTQRIHDTTFKISATWNLGPYDGYKTSERLALSEDGSEYLETDMEHNILRNTLSR